MSSLLLPGGRGLRIMFFGEEGAGKTEMAAGIVRMCPERFLYIDNEGSTTAHPMHQWSKEEPWGLVPLNRHESAKVLTLLEEELALAKQGKRRYDAIALDGLTEYNITLQRFIAKEAHKKQPNEDDRKLSPSGWGTLLGVEVDMGQTLVELSLYGVAVIMTAASEFSDGEHQLLCQGSFGDKIGGYFDLVVYCKQVPGPKFRYHLLKQGPYRTKNRWTGIWITRPKEFPATLESPQGTKVYGLEDIADLVTKAAQIKGGLNAKDAARVT